MRTDSASGDAIEVALDIDLPADQLGAHASVRLVTPEGVVLVDTSSQVREPNEWGRVSMSVRFDRLDVAPGDYTFDVGLYDASWDHTLDLHVGVYGLRVLGGATGGALLAPPRQPHRFQH